MTLVSTAALRSGVPTPRRTHFNATLRPTQRRLTSHSLPSVPVTLIPLRTLPEAHPKEAFELGHRVGGGGVVDGRHAQLARRLEVARQVVDEHAVGGR